MLEKLLTIHNELKILHWQTNSFSEHKALGKAYDSFGEHMDELVETHFGRYGRVRPEGGISIKLYNYELSKPKELLDGARKTLASMREVYETDGATDLSNLTDELIGIIDRTSYLITLS
jgi:hypothetical protein